MLRHLTRLAAAGVDFLYPPECLVCSANQHAPETPHLCTVCLAALLAEVPPRLVDLAARIRQRGIPVYLDECYAAWPYGENVQRVLHAMKYQGKRSLARLLAAGMARRLVQVNGAPRSIAVVAPVPMHPRRERERGYNHSTLLAKELARRWNLPVNVGALRRVVDTLQQALLSAEERPGNVADAFTVKPRKAFADKEVLLVDDIVTTGSTANSCAKVLKHAGAKRIDVIAVASA